MTTRVVLRPIASPLSLGFLALGGATLVLSGQQLGWFTAVALPAVPLALVLFAFPLQLIASIFGFLSRDGVVATGMGLLAATWLTTGVVKLFSPPGSINGALGVLLIFAGAALLVPTVAAASGKLVPAAVLLTAAVRFVLTGIYEVSGAAAVQAVAGVVGLVLLGLAFYAALAGEIEDVRRRTPGPLPLLRVGKGTEAMRGDETDQVEGVEHEAGVREQL